MLHISGPLQYDLLANRRSDAFQITCMKSDIAYEIIEGAHVKATFEDNWDFIHQNIASKLHEMDGIFCSNDIFAYTLYEYVKSVGIEVPEELKIVGYDYHSFTRMLQTPRITTIKQPIKEIGNALASSLIDQIENGTHDNGSNTVLAVELIKGETT